MANHEDHKIVSGYVLTTQVRIVELTPLWSPEIAGL
jgi:hypothetical protein